jgi:hypothetical protein
MLQSTWPWWIVVHGPPDTLSDVVEQIHDQELASIDTNNETSSKSMTATTQEQLDIY